MRYVVDGLGNNLTMFSPRLSVHYHGVYSLELKYTCTDYNTSSSVFAESNRQNARTRQEDAVNGRFKFTN